VDRITAFKDPFLREVFQKGDIEVKVFESDFGPVDKLKPGPLFVIDNFVPIKKNILPLALFKKNDLDIPLEMIQVILTHIVLVRSDLQIPLLSPSFKELDLFLLLENFLLGVFDVLADLWLLIGIRDKVDSNNSQN
jgi:hypothetical protein